MVCPNILVVEHQQLPQISISPLSIEFNSGRHPSITLALSSFSRNKMINLKVAEGWAGNCTTTQLNSPKLVDLPDLGTSSPSNAAGMHYWPNKSAQFTEAQSPSIPILELVNIFNQNRSLFKLFQAPSL